MTAYYQTHAIGSLYLLGVLAWYSMETIQMFRQFRWRKEATRIAPRSYWPAFLAAMAAAVAMLFLAPHILPAARMGYPALGFAIGMVLLVAGVAIRGWSFLTLGRYFTFTVKVSSDQAVVAAGPYRVLRHPGYAGGLLATIGIGVMWGNWLSLATLTLLTAVFILWRIRVEERALFGTLNERYRVYAAQHKRLVPLVW